MKYEKKSDELTMTQYVALNALGANMRRAVSKAGLYAGVTKLQQEAPSYGAIIAHTIREMTALENTYGGALPAKENAADYAKVSFAIKLAKGIAQYTGEGASKDYSGYSALKADLTKAQEVFEEAGALDRSVHDQVAHIQTRHEDCA